MAERVNQRIEDMINELEQMRRTNLYNDEEIREMSRKRKEFEYKIERRVKLKEDFVQYIAFEMALLEDITLRRKQMKLTEKKKDIEYAISKRVNKIFKQLVHRFQNDLEVYFQYIKFCMSVGFHYAVSGIIGEMLLIHGDKPKVWLMASKWESEQQKSLDNAKGFLLKGIQRHPESEILYLELFKLELKHTFSDSEEETKKTEKQLQKLNVIWKNAIKNIPDITFLFKLCDLSIKYGASDTITNNIRNELWSKRSEIKEVWSYFASKELEGEHWTEIEELADNDSEFTESINYYISIYKRALQQFPDEQLYTKFIHGLLGLSSTVCTNNEKINVVKHAWMYGHENGILSNDMYAFGIEMLKLENSIPENELMEILDEALKRNSQAICIWEQKLLVHISDEKEMLKILQEAGKCLKNSEHLVQLWNVMLDNVQTEITVKNLYNKVLNCESTVILALKPKLLEKIYKHHGLKTTREMYEEFIRTPPTQSEVHKVMIEIEMCQEKINAKYIRKCFECLIQHHGENNVDIWMDYIKFETEIGNAQNVSSIYRRAIAVLKKDLVDKFIKVHTLDRIK